MAIKEHAKAFETVEKQQTRIYSDACDYGVAYNSNSIPKDIQSLINFVKDLKDSSLMTRTEYHRGVEVVIRIAWEMDEGMECGTKYTINFCKISDPTLINKSVNSMISVDSKSYRR